MLVMEVHSFAPDADQLLGPLGAAFDADHRFRLVRAGPRDPMPKVKGSAAEALSALGGDGSAPVGILFQLRDDDHGGRLRLRQFGDEGLEDVHMVQLGVPEPVDGEGREAVAALFRRLGEAMDAAWGCVSTPESLRRFGQERRKAAKKAGTLTGQVPSPAGFGFEQAVVDVCWLNLFGPAFVARWGDRLDRVGARSEETAHGGRLVWACEDWRELEPPGDRYDDWQGVGLAGFAPKRSFYEVLGRDVFVHEELTAGEPGEHVPTVAEHRAATGRGGPALDVPWLSNHG